MSALTLSVRRPDSTIWRRPSTTTTDSRYRLTNTSVIQRGVRISTSAWFRNGAYPSTLTSYLYYTKLSHGSITTHTHTRPFLSDIPSSRWETCGEHISFHHFLFLFCIFFLHFFFCERPLVSPEPNHRLFNGEFMRTPSTPISFSSSSSSSSALSTLLRLSVYIATVVYSSCLYMCIYLYISLDDILGRDLWTIFPFFLLPNYLTLLIIQKKKRR